jgi:N-acyl-phosphatidylethanolamine-hydrolysing phospholipase D
MKAKNPHYNPRSNPHKQHHTPKGFRNNYPHATDQNFLKWQQERLKLPPTPTPDGGWISVLPQVKPQLHFLQSNQTDRTITWVSHATVLVQSNGVNIITDPVFSTRTSPLKFAGPKRQVPLPIHIKELPNIDVVFVSHNHYDHLDIGSIKALHQRFPQALYIVPLGLKKWFARIKIHNVVELDWWDSHDYTKARSQFRFTLSPAQHWSKRSFFDTNQSLWGGIVVEDFTESQTTPWRFIYTGDTGYSQDFKDIGAKFPTGFDWAAIPIGAYEPRWFMRAQHINPDEAVQILQDIHAKEALAVHWGTFILTDEPLNQPPKDLAVALEKYQIAGQRFHVFKAGETRSV